MGGKQSAQRYPVRANPSNVVPNMLGSLNQLMEWEEKLPFVKAILASQALWSSVPSSLTGEVGLADRDVMMNPERIRREPEAPTARATTALVHTATGQAGTATTTTTGARTGTGTTQTTMSSDADADADAYIPGPVVSSSGLFGEAAMSHVSQSARRLTPLPPVEQLSSTQTRGETQPTAGITSSVYPQLDTTHAARVLGLTRDEVQLREAVQNELQRLGNTTEIKDRITLICKYFFIHDLLTKMVRASEHCYKLQQRLSLESRQLSNASLAPLQRVQLERRLNTTKQLLTNALGNQDNANHAVSWLRRDFEICGLLYDIKTNIARETSKNQDTRLLKQRQTRIQLDLDDNETKALNLGLFYLDKNWDGVLDAEEVPMLSARLFALLDRDRSHSITPHNLQQAALEANERVRSLSVRLSGLEQDVSALQNKPGEEAQARLQRILDEQERVKDQKIQLLAVVRAIVRYFHRAFTLHLFSKLDDDTPSKVQPVDAKAIFRVMDDVMVTSYFDPVKPAAAYFTKEQEQHMLYDTLGPMKTGIIPSRGSALDMADTVGAARLDRGTAERELISLKPGERQHAIQVSQAYPSAPEWGDMETYETTQEIRERERSRQDMLRDVERRDMAARSSRLSQQQQERQREMELAERQHQEDMTREQQMRRQQQETADRERERQREQERMRAEQMSRERAMRQQQQQQREQDMINRQRERQEQEERVKRDEQQAQQRERERERKYQQEQSYERQVAAEREHERAEREQRRAAEEQERERQRRREQERERERERERIMQQERERQRLEQAEAQAEAAERQRERERALHEEEMERQRRVTEYQARERERERERERQRDRERADYEQTRLKQQQPPSLASVPARGPAPSTAPVPVPVPVPVPAPVPAGAPAPARGVGPAMARDSASARAPSEGITYEDIPHNKSWLARERDEAATGKIERDVLTPMRESGSGPSLKSRPEYKEPYEHEYEYDNQQPQQPSITQRIKQAASSVLGTGTGTQTETETETGTQNQQPAF